MRFPGIRILGILNTLSIDIAIGAVMSAVFANTVFRFRAEAWYYLVLFLSVWVVYTADHLIDALKNKEKTFSRRHLFYYRHFRSVVYAIVVLTLAIAHLLYAHFQPVLLGFGLAIGSSSAMYLFFVSRSKRPSLWLMKELYVALIYTAGIWGFPVWMRAPFAWKFWLFPFRFFLLVFFVLLVYSRYDAEEDRKDGYFGMASAYYPGKIKKLMRMILWLSILLFVPPLWIFDYPRIVMYEIIFGAMWSLSVFLYCKDEILQKDYRYRILGEWIFFLPGIVIGIRDIITFTKNFL